MRVCVLSPGVVHSVPRTVSIAPHFDSVHFIDISGKADFQPLINAGITCYGPADVASGRFNVPQTVDLLNKIDPDVIVCHFASGNHFFNAIAYGNRPVAAIAMGQDVLYDKGDKYITPLRRLLVRMGLRQTIFIAAKSTTLVNRIKSYAVSCPVQLNYWGCDLGKFVPGDSATARIALDLPAGRLIILSSRAVEPRLNIDLIVRAVDSVRDKYPDILLVIIGRSDVEYLKKVSELISQCNLEENVLIVGEVTQQELPQYYIASDIVISMASSEGFPNTVLEVMSCEIPLLIGELPQIAELLEDGVHCRICHIDVEAIRMNLVEMLGDSTNKIEMIQNGKELVRRVADIENNGYLFSNELKVCMQSSSRVSLAYRMAFQLLYLLSRISISLKNKIRFS